MILTVESSLGLSLAGVEESSQLLLLLMLRKTSESRWLRIEWLLLKTQKTSRLKRAAQSRWLRVEKLVLRTSKLRLVMLRT